MAHYKCFIIISSSSSIIIQLGKKKLLLYWSNLPYPKIQLHPRL